VAKPETSRATKNGRFGPDDFIYDPTKDEYRCPGGQALIWRFSTVRKELTEHRYWSSICANAIAAQNIARR
jgi:hypothetical protein